MKNPYGYTSDADDDLFATDETRVGAPRGNHKHTIDGTICPSCQVAHDMQLPDDFPPEAIEALLTMLDEMPAEAVKHIVSITAGEIQDYVKVATKFFDMLESLDQDNADGPILRAVVEALDATNDGATSRRIRIYTLERGLITTHAALRSANNVYEQGKADEVAPEYLGVLDMLCEHMLDRIELLTEQYREACEETADYDPIDAIIDHGKYQGALEEHYAEYMFGDVFSHMQNRI